MVGAREVIKTQPKTATRGYILFVDVLEVSSNARLTGTGTVHFVLPQRHNLPFYDLLVQLISSPLVQSRRECSYCTVILHSTPTKLQ